MPKQDPIDVNVFRNLLERDVQKVEEWLNKNRDRILEDVRLRRRRPVIQTFYLPDTVAELFDNMGPGNPAETIFFYYILDTLMSR